MREEIKQIFLNSNQQFISGEEISKQLNISRTAVWKQIEELKKEGYQFEAITRKGYRLLSMPDDISTFFILNGLKTDWLGREMHSFQSLESTQLKAHQLAKNNANHGSVVIANEQTNGKGRLGRSWYSARGKGIWLSIILRPSFHIQAAPLLTLLASIVISRTIRNKYGLDVRIKWPNDIYINDKKLSGVLTEMVGELDRIHYLIIGIGINTHRTEYPDDLSHKATALEEVLGYPIKRSEFVQDLLYQFEQLYNSYLTDGFTSFIKEYNDRLMWRGVEKELTHQGRKINGIIKGIDQNGHLIIKAQNGSEIKIVSGEIDT